MMDAEGPMGAPQGPLASNIAELPSAPGDMGPTVIRDRAGQVTSYTEESVLQMVRCLNSPTAQGPSGAAANEYLTNFQRDPSAWGICISILNKHANWQQQQQQQQVAAVIAASPEVLHFAAQTLAAQARAGFPQQISALLHKDMPPGVSTAVSEVDGFAGSARVYAELRDGLLQLVFAFRNEPMPVLRQLCIALTSALIFGCSPREEGSPASGGPCLGPVLQNLGSSAGTEGFLPLFELLALLPEELCAKRIALSEGLRLSCLAGCMRNDTAEVLKILEAVFAHAQAAHDNAELQQRPRWRAILHAAVRALQSWLAAACSWLQLQEPDQGAPPTSPSGALQGAMAALSLILQRVSEGTMFTAVLRGATSDDLETLQLSSDCVVTVIAAVSKLEETVALAAAAETGGEGSQSQSVLTASNSNTSGTADKGRAKIETVCRCLIATVVQVYGQGCSAALAAAKEQQPAGIAAFDVERLQAFAQGITELAKVQIPRLLAETAESEARLEEGDSCCSTAAAGASAAALQPSVENICELSRALLKHPSYEVKEVAISFFRNLLSHMMVLVEEERRLAAWRDHLRNEAANVAAAERSRDKPAEGTAVAAAAAGDCDQASGIAAALAEVERRYERNLQALALREPVLSRLFYPFGEAAVQQLQPPVHALLSEEMEFETWQNFRAELASIVTEAAVLLDIEALCNASAAQLLRLLKEIPRAGVEKSWLEIEARLFFVSTVANRIRLTVSPSSVGAGGVGESTAAAASAGAYGETQEAGDCVLQLLQLLPQLPFPAQPRQTTAAAEETTEAEVVSLFLHSAVARTSSWLSPRVIPQHQSLFAPLFSLLATQSLEFVTSLPDAPKGSNVALLRLSTEALLVEGISSLVASAAAFIPSPGREQDVNALLNALTAAFSRPGLSLDNSSVLMQTAGYVISCLEGPRIRTLFSQLLQSLGSELERCLSDPRCPSSTMKRSLTLFFSAVQAVQPAEDYCPPPSSQTFEPLSPRSGYRHPVLDAVEGCWPTIEKAMKQPHRSEFLYEVTCYALVALCGNCRAHMPRYGLFYSFLETLASTFAESPTVYHLGALRSLEGISSNSQEQCVRRAVAAALEGCVGATLQKIKAEGEKYLYNQPDLVGISIDCVNVALLHPLSAQPIVSQDWFELLTVAVIQFTPTCHHPKVLHTNMVFLSRLAAWVDPPSLIHCYQIGEPIPWLSEVADETQAAVVSLLRRPFPQETAATPDGEGATSFLARAIAAVLLALTSVHAAPQSWIGSAAQALLPLLRHRLLGATAKNALEFALRGIDPHIMDEERKRDFCWKCTRSLSVREMCLLLQQTADDTKASYVRNKFALGGPSRSPHQAACSAC